MPDAVLEQEVSTVGSQIVDHETALSCRSDQPPDQPRPIVETMPQAGYGLKILPYFQNATFRKYCIFKAIKD